MGGLGPLSGPMWAVLGRSGRSRRLCGRSWVALGACAGGLGPLLGPLRAVLGRSWGFCGRSWAALGASVGGLGCSWGPCWRSWAALGASFRGLGPLLGPLLAVLGCLGPKSGPGPSGKAIWQADQGRKVAQTRAGRPLRRGERFTARTGPPNAAGPPCRFFLVDMYMENR